MRYSPLELALAFCTVATTANAASLTQSYNTLISSSGVVEGSINIQLAPNEYVQSAYLEAIFADDGDRHLQIYDDPGYQLVSYTPIVSCTPTCFVSGSIEWHRRDITRSFFDDQEIASLSSGTEQRLAASGTWTYHGQPILTQHLVTHVPVGLGMRTYEDNVYDIEVGFTVIFSARLVLTTALLESLNESSAISWKVSSILSDFKLVAVTLNYTTDVSTVPIPGALPLFASALGLGGFLGYRRKRKAGTG